MVKQIIFGCGYIGSALLHHLQEQGHNDVVVTTTSNKKRLLLQQQGAVAHVVQGSDKESVANVLKLGERLVVAVAPAKGQSYRETYFNTAETICSCLSSESSIKHLIYLSSSSVYGDRGGSWISEEDPVQPTTENSQILCDTEDLLLKEVPNLIHLTILRLGGIYGPGRTHSSRVKRLAGSSLPGSGQEFSNWVHQEDIVRAIEWSFDYQLTGVYNLCSDDHPTKQELYDTIAKEIDIEKVIWDSTKIGSHAGSKRVSNEKMKATGFSFLHNTFGPEEWISR